MYEPKFLLPTPRWTWRTPSAAQWKDEMGNDGLQTRFRVRALVDGKPVWIGIFDDRDDWDAFLWSMVRGHLKLDRELWDYPTETWTPQSGWGRLGWYPGIGEHVQYDFATMTFLATTSASNQTWTVDATWNSSNNQIDVIATGGSGSGAGTNGSGTGGSGGAGAAWSSANNITLTPGGSANFFLAAGKTGGTAGGATGGTGVTGDDAWFNGATLGASSCGAKGGQGVAMGSGSTGGAAGSCIGNGNKASGGNGGTGNGAVSPGGGAGAAAGPGVSRAGGTGGNGSTGTQGGAGGGADGGGSSSSSSGGAGANSGGSGGNNGAVGGNGQEWDSTHGSGGGGGGGATSGGNPGRVGGNYGAGGGGGSQFGGAQGAGGNSVQGLIVLVWTPKVSGFNLPMLGM